MARYLISFDDGAMPFAGEKLAEVAEAGMAVVREAHEAGVWVIAGGLRDHHEMSVVGTDGAVTDAPPSYKESFLGGFAIIDVPSREQALWWAAKIAAACRCAQEVREFVPDPMA